MNTISVRGTGFVDELGRERVFNGLNFVYKGCLPDEDGVIRYKMDVITDELLSALTAKGINIIRLGLTWAGVEPEQGQYNTAYLDGVKEALKLCEKHSVYAFLDWHQDLYSYYACSGDGAPRWACKGSGKPKKPIIIWAFGYFIYPCVHRSFDAFWKNEKVNGKGLQDSFCDMLKYTVSYLSDCKAVMGYDVFNEPFPGTPGGKAFRTLVANGAETLLFNKRVDRRKLVTDALSGKVMEMLSVADDRKVYKHVIDPAAKLIRRFDTERYYPFLQRAAEAIREVTPDGVIFSENCYYSNLGIPCSYPALCRKNGEREPNFAFSPHGYDITVDTPLTNEASPYRVDHIFDEHENTQARLGAPVLVGEWGGMVPGGEKYPALEHLIDKFDRNRWSQTYWHYHKGLEDGKIMDILSRPLPQAVAGTIKSYGYDRANGVFTLSYTGSSVIKAPTLIYLPREPKKIYSTKAYVLKEVGGARILSVYAGKGECVVKVEFR